MTIPNSVKSIGEYAFYGCSGLTSISIGQSVNTIGEKSFAECYALKDVYCYAEKRPSTKENAFSGSSIPTATLHVPSASIEDYKSNVPWSIFGNIVALNGETPGADKYKLVYVVDGATYKTYEVEVGKTITPEPSPTKTGYTFSGWTGLPTTMPAHDVTVTGTFTKNPGGGDEDGETLTVNGVEYKIKGGNIIQNGTFDEGFSYWTGANDYATTITSSYFSIRTEEEHGNYLVGTANMGQSTAGSLGTAWSIEPDKTYYFAYDVKYLGSADGEPLYIKSSLTNAKGEETEILGLPTLKSGEWTTFEKVFTNSDEYAYCQVRFRWLNGLYGFDNFKLYEVEMMTSELDAAKQEAIASLDELPVGEGLFLYSAQDIAQRKAAVEAAESVEAVNAVGTPAPHLPEANTAYIFSLKTEDEGSPYELRLSEYSVDIVNAGEGTPVYLAPLEDGKWSISANGRYLNCEENYDFRRPANLGDAPFGWIIRVIEGGYSIMGRCNGKDGYLGTERSSGNGAGSSCYGDMTWIGGNIVWTIEKSDRVADAIHAPEDTTSNDVHAVYSLDGKPANTLQKGVNIIRMENGKAKKVLVK